MGESKQSGNGESNVELTSTNPSLADFVPICCRENYDDCIHKLKPEPKREYNPV